MGQMMRSILLGVAVLLSGCASQVMESYVGKSIKEPILDYGPPINVVDLGANRQAFQWRIDSSGVIPMTTPSTATIAGTGGFATMQTTSTTYLPYSNSCVYTLTATKNGSDYIVDGYRKPRFECE